MQRPKTKTRNLRAVFAAALAALGLAVCTAGHAQAATAPKAPPPAAALGIWTSAEDSGSYSPVPGQHPDIANYYQRARQPQASSPPRARARVSGA